ncbi:MAG: TIGR03618 family F420-dependent PPOX class oxidoreductase [Candidatus Dormibacteria bacterium]
MAELSDRQRGILSGKNFYTVSTIGRDGSPRSTTIWGDLEGDEVTVNTREGRGWLANIRRDPRVAIAVHDAEDPYAQVSLRGRVVEVTSEGAQAHIDALSRKYTGHDYGVQPDQVRVRVRISLESARSWGVDLS